MGWHDAGMDQTASLHPSSDGEAVDNASPSLDPQACYRALKARDARFDGRFFVGVTSTGIYCRPICPAPSAKFTNCRFYGSAAAAREAGFRPCLRCRPETAPEIGAWAGTSNTVRRGLALIAEGALDDDCQGVEQLAARLGIGERQLRRLFQEHLGASPIAVAQTRRIHLAKQLIHDTRLPMAEIAMAAGFGSVRRFNETFQALYHRPPSALRRKTQTALGVASAASGVTVKLPYRPPYDWPFMLSYLAARAIPGIEMVVDERYLRAVDIDGAFGTIEITHDGAKNSLIATIQFPNVKALPTLIARIKRIFDLGADVGLICHHLAQDPMLAPFITARPGLRAPGGWDGFELAIRAILGQQVTVTAGRQLAALAQRLQAAGWAADTPVSVVSRAGWPDALASAHSIATLGRATVLHSGRPTVVTVGAGAAAVSRTRSESPLLEAGQEPEETLSA